MSNFSIDNNYGFKLDVTEPARLIFNSTTYGWQPNNLPGYEEWCKKYIETDINALKEACRHHNNKTITKIIMNYKQDKKPGIYTTVQFEDKFVTVKKSFDDPTIIDLHVACAFAYTKLRFGSHSHFKKMVDRKIQDVTENYKFFQWYDSFKKATVSVTIPKDVDDIYEFIAVSIFNDYLGRNSSNMDCYADAVKAVKEEVCKYDD